LQRKAIKRKEGEDRSRNKMRKINKRIHIKVKFKKEG
jgi:hypothetical protein